MIAVRARIRRDHAGFVLVLGVVGLALVVLVLGTVLALALRERRQIQAEERQIQAAWLAEAGAERARARLELDPSYTGETWVLDAVELGSHAGQVEIHLEPLAEAPERLNLLVRADFPKSGPGRTRVTRQFSLTRPHRSESEERP